MCVVYSPEAIGPVLICAEVRECPKSPVSSCATLQCAIQMLRGYVLQVWLGPLLI